VAAVGGDGVGVEVQAGLGDEGGQDVDRHNCGQIVAHLDDDDGRTSAPAGPDFTRCAAMETWRAIERTRKVVW